MKNTVGRVKLKKDKYICKSGEFCIHCEMFTASDLGHIRPYVCFECIKKLKKMLRRGVYISKDGWIPA